MPSAIRKRKKRNLSEYTIIDFIMMVVFLTLCSGYVMSYYSGVVMLSLLFVLCGFLFLYNIKAVYINKNILIAEVFSICLILITFLINREDLKQLAIFLCFAVITVLITMIYKFDKMVKLYCDVMLFISGFSLFIFGLGLLAPGMTARLPVVYNVHELQANYAFFTVFVPGENRNYGIFWEPGAYQTYINIALVLTLFIRRKYDIKCLLIYSAAIITTISTMGYIAFVLIIFAFLIEHYKENKKVVLYICCIVIVISLVVACFFILIPNAADYFIPSVTKLFTENDSMAIRTDSIIIPMQFFIRSPIWGHSYTGLREAMMQLRGHSLVTCTPVNWIAIYGTGGLIYIIGLYHIAALSSKKIIIRLLVFCIILLTMVSEDYTRNPTIMMFCFYGYGLTQVKINIRIKTLLQKTFIKPKGPEII